MGLKAIFSIDDHYETSATSEELLYQWSTDLATFGDAELEVQFTALAKATGGASGTFNVRVGGAIGTVDGEVAATISTSNSTYAQLKGVATVGSPATLTLLKLTGRVSDGAQTADLTGAVVTLRGAAEEVMPAAPPTTGPPRAGQFDRLWGHDIWFDISSPAGGDYIVMPKGDWKDVTGPECLRQALLREWVTNPGEWATLPEYGAGARQYVKGRARRTEREALAQRLRARALANPRVASVEDVKVEQLADGLKLSVVVIPRGANQRAKPLAVVMELR